MNARVSVNVSAFPRLSVPARAREVPKIIGRKKRLVRGSAEKVERGRGGDVQREEEHERVVVVVPGRGDDRGRDEGPDERGRLADHGEQREEEEPMAHPTPRESAFVAALNSDDGTGSRGVKQKKGIEHAHLRKRRHLANHGLAVCVPRAHHQAVIRLV